MPDALRPISTRISDIASGATEADANLFAALDEIYRLFGHEPFSRGQLRPALGLNPLSVDHYLNRALARGSLEMIRNGVFRIPREAISPSGEVSRDIRGFSSRLATRAFAKAIVRLFDARSSGELTGPFTRQMYGERSSVSHVKIREELALGVDLGLLERMGTKHGKQWTYRFKHDARLPDALRPIPATARISDIASGATEADANLFAALDEVYRLFGHEPFSLGQLRPALGLNPLSVNHYLNRALARGSLEMIGNGVFRIPREAVSPSGEVSRDIRGFSSRLVTRAITKAIVHLFDARSSGELTGPFTRQMYGERSSVSHVQVKEELALGVDLGLLERIGTGHRRQQWTYRFKLDAQLPSIIARAVKAARRR